MKTPKEIAVEFLNAVVAGRIDAAYAGHVDLAGTHHNVFFPPGLATLREAMKDNEKQFPGKQFAVKHVVGEGDLVVTHSQLTMKPGAPGMIVFHMFRFKNGKIVELWDCGQAIPADSPNPDPF